ncbi:MAG: CoA transferase [Alphaproteobacteria bacterium]|nr:CoA transferase [Alphaproteobacteria bacterium]
MSENKSGLLAGLRVIEMSHVMAAPTCGMMLADMGADVIKVERVPGGDGVRRNAPHIDGYSAPFTMMNRNKRGFAVNTKTPEGLATLRRLIGGADIFIENYRPGAMDHYGIGYGDLKADFPALVYCSLSGFGKGGPLGQQGGFDLVAQGMSGLMSYPGEGAGRPPVKVGSPVTDITAGILAAMSILGAIVQRGQTGKGQSVETSLFEAGIALSYWQSAIHLASGEIPGAMGSAHPLMAPYQAFQTSDGWINVGAASQATWEGLVKCLDDPALGKDPRFVDNLGRMKHLDELVADLTERFVKKSTDDWLALLEEYDVPAGPVLDVKQMAVHPQTTARNMIRDVPGGDRPDMKAIGHPVKFSESHTEIMRPAPRLGEHSREVLLEGGFSEDEADALITAGAVHQD